jgi:hypothetical protein
MNKNIETVAVCLVVILVGLSAACEKSPSTRAGAPSNRELATSFDEFPILWLGDSYDSDGDGVGDLPLRDAHPARSAPLTNPLTGEVIRPATRSFTLSYGDCQIKPGRQSCPAPVTIVFYPTGSAPILSEAAKTGETLSLRGVKAVVYGEGNLWVETADVTFAIDAFAATPEERRRNVTRIATQLEGANAKARKITKTTDFAPATGSAETSTTVPGSSSTPLATQQTPAPPPGQPTIPAPATTLTIAVGAPSLVGGRVYVPITTTGADSIYSGFSVHLRWDSAVFSASPANTSGSTLDAPFCPDPIVDGDGGGATYSCIATGGPTKATGLLTTIVLSPAASGCSALHLFTYGATDGGDAITGTFLVDAGSSKPLAAQYVDGSASVDGKTC